jgi:hypothetical protein
MIPSISQKGNHQYPRLPRRYLRARPTPPTYGTAGLSMPLHFRASTICRKADLVALENWAVATGRGWLVRAVETALASEGLTRA